MRTGSEVSVGPVTTTLLRKTLDRGDTQAVRWRSNFKYRRVASMTPRPPVGRKLFQSVNYLSGAARFGGSDADRSDS
jgi:hypothetical protein